MPQAQAIPTTIEQGRQHFPAILRLPDNASGLVIFAHGSGSGRTSPRNNGVAAALADSGYASLLLDLLTAEEASDRRNVFDIPLLASHLLLAIHWCGRQASLRDLPLALFGASTGAAAALLAAVQDDRIRTLVSRGGRPDLAEAMLPAVRAPTLLIVGGEDPSVLALNEQAFEQLGGPKSLVVVPGAGHLFEEQGTLATVTRHAILWFDQHLAQRVGAVA